MASNSATKLATQQSIKAYVDAQGYTWKGEWATSTVYAVNDTVEHDGSGYVCVTAHTSGTFSTDLSAGKWELFVEGLPEILTNPKLNEDVAVTIKASELNGILSGWIPAGETWTYNSADDPTYTFKVNADVTGKYSAGMKIKLTQTTVKYFIITAVSAYSGGYTTITVYGGTDYDLAEAGITNPYYSMVKSPQGFLMNPDKWSVVTTYTSNGEQTSPTVNVWYNIGSVSLSIPVGVWDVSYKCEGQHYRTSGDSWCSIYATLSTANNSESDADFTCHGFARNVLEFSSALTTRKIVSVASKTPYYLNFKTDQADTAGLHHYGGLTKTIVKAICAYL